MPSLISVSLLCLTASFASLVQWNPLLFGKSSINSNVSSLPKSTQFFVFEEHDVLDEALIQHVARIDSDLDAYRNHCLRVLSLAIHYHSNGKGLRRVPQKLTDMMALSITHSKLALWDMITIASPASADTNGDPIEMGVALLHSANEKPQKYHRHEFSNVDHHSMESMIRAQYKLTSFVSNDDDDPQVALLADAVRKAQWTDLTMGTIRFDGLPLSYVEKMFLDLPGLGYFDRVVSRNWASFLGMMRL